MTITTATFLDLDSVHSHDLDLSLLEQSVPNWRWRNNTVEDELIAAIKDAEVIVTNKVVLNEQHLQQANTLKLICVAATGVNNVDLAAAKQCGISVCNAQAYATASVVQHVFSLILALNRSVTAYHRAAIDGRWSKSEFFCYFDKPFDDLAGKTIGIIGYGELGRAVATMAGCFGMQVLLAKRSVDDDRPGRVDLALLLEKSDVISLHCPLTANNRHIISGDEFSKMKSDAILINTARGGLVNEVALLDALQNQQIAGAALDVLEEEPPPQSHPLLNYSGDNLIITPHVAWASHSSRQRLIEEVANNILEFQQGRPRNLV